MAVVFLASGYSSEVEPQPSKLMTRVRFPLPAPDMARIAQAVEHFIGNEEVPGSTPGVSTRYVGIWKNFSSP